MDDLYLNRRLLYERKTNKIYVKEKTVFVLACGSSVFDRQLVYEKRVRYKKSYQVNVFYIPVSKMDYSIQG